MRIKIISEILMVFIFISTLSLAFNIWSVYLPYNTGWQTPTLSQDSTLILIYVPIYHDANSSNILIYQSNAMGKIDFWGVSLSLQEPENAATISGRIVIIIDIIVVILVFIVIIKLFRRKRRSEKKILKQKERERERKQIKESERVERERREREKKEKEKSDRVERERKKRLDKETIEKINKMMRVSTRINLDRMQNVLDMDKRMFDKKIFEWAEEFGFTIDGDYLIINKNMVSEFINELDRQFKTWKQSDEKIE